MDDIQKRLSGRINLLSDFNITVDEVNDMIYINCDRELDMSITELRWLTKKRFSTYLNNVTEAYLTTNEL